MYWTWDLSDINFKIIMINTYKKIDDNVENFIRELYSMNKDAMGKSGTEKNQWLHLEISIHVLLVRFPRDRFWDKNLRATDLLENIPRKKMIWEWQCGTRDEKRPSKGEILNKIRRGDLEKV